MIPSETEKVEAITAFASIIEAKLTLYNLNCHRDFQVSMLEVIKYLEKK